MITGSRISVVIPSRDYGGYISEAIESVLSQTLKPAEVIVVDDGSADNTAEIVKKYSPEVSYFFIPGKGVGFARNHGIEHSSGEYIAHLDADDRWVPEKLEIQMEEFMKDPELEITGGMMQPFYDPSLSEERRKKVFCSPVPLPGFSASVILVKRESFDRVGPYITHMNLGQDLDWFVRARELPLKERMVERLLAYRRLHGRHSSMSRPDDRKERLMILRESLARKRGE